ncbi:MAG: cytochrome c3 family protein [Anaerolineae bacterium]
MKQLWTKLLALLGCAFIVIGMGFLATGQYTVYAQNEPAEYVGSKECASCHRNLARSHGESNHALALQEVARRNANVLGDFEQGEDVRTVQIPGEDTARPFTADDIALVVGAGRHVQRYLYEVDRNDYMVLPAEWNVETQTWETVKLADEWPDPAYDWEQNCAYCHTTGYDVERGRWKDIGVQCEACHGPASIHVELAKDAGRRPSDEEFIALRGAIFTAPDPQVCGQCHSQGVSQDNHPYPVGYVPGTDLSQVFTLVGKDSGNHWWVSGHGSQPNMQYNEWFNNSHASALTDMLKSDNAANECLNCHSQDARQTAALIAAVESGDRDGQPLDPITTDTAKWGVTCTTCHYPHTDSEQPSDLVQEANSLCISCHTNPTETASGVHHPVKEMFEGTALVADIDGVAGAHFSAEGGPVCMTCHMQSISVGTTNRISHLFKPVLPSTEDNALPSACSQCHTDLTVTDLQSLVTNTQDVVKSRLAVAYARLGSITKPEDSDPSRTQYDQAVAALSFVQNDGSLGIHNYAYVDKLLSTAENDLFVLSRSGASPQPTEGPAPTAPAGAQNVEVRATEVEVASSGVRPITVLLMTGVILIILTAGFAFFRKSGDREDLR